jgi:hypothetical protein
MEPSEQLVDEIYREKVLRARMLTPDRRAQIGAELSDLSRQMMREAIRRQFPMASEQSIHELMRRRVDLSRRLDDTSMPASENAA